MRKKLAYFCVKMTVAVQIEGKTEGMQTVEERYVLFKVYTEAEARSKAEATASTYGKPYRNSDGVLVRWKIESIDSVYEVVPDNLKNLDGAEVFSTLKRRKLTPDRIWESLISKQ